MLAAVDFRRRVVFQLTEQRRDGGLLAGLGSERSRSRLLAGLVDLPVVRLLGGVRTCNRRPVGRVVVRLAGQLLDVADILLHRVGVVDEIAGELRRSPGDLIVRRALIDHVGDLRQLVGRDDMAPLINCRLFGRVLALRLNDLLLLERDPLLNLVRLQPAHWIEIVGEVLA